ncbi:hypothetical protein ACFONL_06665 [Camelimonas fluminis]|uniref:PXPV repeat-containing protein n=1 Tax=Camelimonas fluminis TaxID=1576911 RepID=A0ABV7UEE8_9HYPH|nr:hypothetical protein [Camelimonas fluminis]
MKAIFGAIFGAALAMGVGAAQAAPTPVGSVAASGVGLPVAQAQYYHHHHRPHYHRPPPYYRHYHRPPPRYHHRHYGPPPHARGHAYGHRHHRHW